MSNHRNELLDLHPAAVAGAFMVGRPRQAHALRDAEPEIHSPQQSLLRRTIVAVRGRPVARHSAQPS